MCRTVRHTENNLKELPVIVNSDAHAPEYVGRFSEAMELLKEMEFNEKLILNTSIEKFHQFIHC